MKDDIILTCCRIQKRLDDDQLSKDEVNGKIDEKVAIIAKV